MAEFIKNIRNKTVAEVDKATKTVVIKKRDCKTTIHFTESGELEIENTISITA